MKLKYDKSHEVVVIQTPDFEKEITLEDAKELRDKLSDLITSINLSEASEKDYKFFGGL